MGPTGPPGCALGVYNDGQIVYKRGYGMADLNEVWGRHHDLPGRGVPNGHGGSNMPPDSQQPLQRPPCLKLWSGHRRLGQHSFVQSRRPSIAPQLTHLDGMGIPSAPTMQDQQSYIWSMLLTSEGNQSYARLVRRFQFN